MQWKTKIRVKKDPFRPMFLFMPRYCDKCGLWKWLEFVKPSSEARFGTKCEICFDEYDSHNFMDVPLIALILLVLFCLGLYILFFRFILL